MDLGLQDTVALVVDSHLGIATAAAASLAREGAILSLTAPDNYNMRHVEIELARSNIPQDRFRAVIADLTRTRDIHRLVRETLHRQNDVGVLVNTVQELDPSSAVELEEENIEPALARNFFAAVQLTREVVPHMKRLGRGRIVNLIPYSAIEVSSGGTLSSLSLAPLLAYFKGLAFDLASENITVNNIIYFGVEADASDNNHAASDAVGSDGGNAAGSAGANGYHGNGSEDDTPMHRMAAPHEIGDVVAMVASSRASYLTGANIILDGGRHRQYYA